MNILKTQALKNGLKAYGAKFIKPGFAFTPEDDLAFALGYPYMVFISEENPKEKAKAEADIRAVVRKFSTKNYLSLGGVWPELIALSITNDWSFFYRKTLELRTKNAFTEAEVKKIIDENIDGLRSHELLYILEAFVGPEIVTEAFISKLEKLSKEEWDDVTDVAQMGLILLRLTEPDYKKAMKRLEALYQKMTKNKGKELPRGVQSLDVFLNGTKGAERSGYYPDDKNLSSYSMVYVQDNPEWICKHLALNTPDKWSTFNPRIAFLGGEKALSEDLKHWKEYRTEAKKMFVQEVGKIKSPIVMKFMLEVAADKYKKDVTTWFLEHQQYSKKFLETASKKSDAAGKLAKEILQKF